MFLNLSRLIATIVLSVSVLLRREIWFLSPVDNRFAGVHEMANVRETGVKNVASAAVALTVSVTALVSCVLAIQSGSRIFEIGETFPRGDAGPEAVACDYVRAFIAQNESLFHKRRVKQYCEGWADPAIAYRRFLDYTPQTEADGSKPAALPFQPVRIVRVSPVETSPTSAEAGRIQQQMLQIFDGCIERKYIDVVVADESGRNSTIRLETVHRGEYAEDGMTFRPTGVWKARFAEDSHWNVPLTDNDPFWAGSADADQTVWNTGAAFRDVSQQPSGEL